MKRTEEETQKHTMLLYAGDFVKLQELYPELGASLVVRRLVRNHIKALDPAAKPVEANIEL